MERLESLARAAGVRGARLEDVNRRRAQLWLWSLLVGLALPGAFLVLDLLPPEVAAQLHPTAVRIGLTALLLAVGGYVIERERSLRGLTGLLVEERTRTAVLEARVRELDLLLRAGRAVNASLDLDAVLGIILTSTSELLAASEGSIALVRPEAPDELEIVATWGASSASRGEVVQIGAELAGLARFADPALTDPMSTVMVAESGAALAVPLLHRDELVGVLDLCAPDAAFTEFQLRLVAVFAETAAAAITNARLHEASEASVATLTELDALKDEFLALVTHELRTPLTAVIGLAQTIERGGERLTPEKVAELARLIGRQGWRLDRLVDDLLRSTEVRRGLPALSPEPVDTLALAREIVAGLQAGAPDHALSVDLPSEPVVRILDSDAVHRILVNLVGNAVKYTPPGSTVVVTVRPDGPDGVVLVVDDDGPGIPEAEWPFIFDKFRRGAALGSGGGLGLGLYLVRALAAAHHGTATLDHGPRGGSRFTIALTSQAERPSPLVPAPT